MARFVSGFGNQHRGYPLINLDKVFTAEPVRENSATVAYRLFDAMGNEIGKVDTRQLPEYSAATVVPNSVANLQILTAWFDDDGNPNWQRYPILAWRVSDSYAEPVTYRSLDDYVCLEQLDQTGQAVRWIVPNDCEFDNFDEVVKEAKESHEWQRKYELERIEKQNREREEEAKRRKDALQALENARTQYRGQVPIPVGGEPPPVVQ